MKLSTWLVSLRAAVRSSFSGAFVLLFAANAAFATNPFPPGVYGPPSSFNGAAGSVGNYQPYIKQWWPTGSNFPLANPFLFAWDDFNFGSGIWIGDILNLGTNFPGNVPPYQQGNVYYNWIETNGNTPGLYYSGPGPNGQWADNYFEQYLNLKLAPRTTYYWQIIPIGWGPIWYPGATPAQQMMVVYPPVMSFTTGDAPAITLVSPAQGAYMNYATSSTATYSWNGNPMAVSYELQIATDANFTQNLHDYSNIAGTSYRPGLALGVGNYYWRVRAIYTNPYTPGPWSASGYFRAIAIIIVPPILHL